MQPHRGEVWIAYLGRDAQGTELGGKVGKDGRRQPSRPVLVVSSDNFNEESDRVTVIPLMKYKEGREYTRNWAFRIFRDQVKRVEKVDGQLEYPINLVDCGQFSTLNYRGKHTDLSYFCGRIEEHQIYRYLSLGLQMVLAGRLTAHFEDGSDKATRLPVSYGDVIELNWHASRCAFLVVSSPAVDQLRDYMELPTFHGMKRLQHITVVRLDTNKYEQSHTAIAVKTRHDNTQASKAWTALCQEIYTFNWSERRLAIVGKVAMNCMQEVDEAIRKYLDLPSGYIDV